MKGITAACLTTLCLTTACSRTDPGTHQFEVLDEAGVTVALTTGGPRFTEPLFTYELLLTLHQDVDRPESLLFNPGAILPGPDGKYYVCDRGSGRIAVFDADGEFERAFGRKGEGPGEFRMMELQSLKNGVLSIFDYNQQRTTLFGTDGILVKTFPSAIGGYALGLERTPEGTLLQEGVRVEQDGLTAATQRRIIVARAGSRDTLAVISTGFVRDTHRLVQTMPDGSMISVGRPLPFSGSAAVRYVPGHGIVVTDGERPELTWYDTAGRKLRTIRIDLPALPVTAQMKQDFLARERAQAEPYENRAGRNPLPSDYDWPDTVGFWRRTQVDAEGYIWCLDVLAVEERTEGDDFLFHVINPEGRYLGTASLPVWSPRIGGGIFTCLIEDPETGDTAASVFRLQPAVEGLIYPR